MSRNSPGLIDENETLLQLEPNSESSLKLSSFSLSSASSPSISRPDDRELMFKFLFEAVDDCKNKLSNEARLSGTASERRKSDHKLKSLSISMAARIAKSFSISAAELSSEASSQFRASLEIMFRGGLEAAIFLPGRWLVLCKSKTAARAPSSSLQIMYDVWWCHCYYYLPQSTTAHLPAIRRGIYLTFGEVDISYVGTDNMLTSGKEENPMVVICLCPRRPVRRALGPSFFSKSRPKR